MSLDGKHFLLPYHGLGRGEPVWPTMESLLTYSLVGGVTTRLGAYLFTAPFLDDLAQGIIHKI